MREIAAKSLPMPIQFHKMHGAGNDFVLLDYRHSDDRLDPEVAAQLADRRKGVGCDQVLVLRSASDDSCAARYEIYNADGSMAGQCGNGVRCIALYLLGRGEFDTGAADENSVSLDGPAGVVRVRRCPDGEFECAMGVPQFDPERVPLDLEHPDILRKGERFELKVGINPVLIGAVSMGNPHAVTEVDSVENAPVAELGPRISAHTAFPDGCNAGFAEVIDPGNIRLRVFERGTGETLACGSGACAAVAVLARGGRVSDTVNVFLPGGLLVIKWRGTGREMTMKGPAAHVFRGTLDE